MIGDPHRVEARDRALAAQPPFNTEDDDGDFHLTVDNPRASAPVQQSVARETVGAGFFATLDEPPLAGREFTRADQRIEADEGQTTGGHAVALPIILNQKAARGLFGDEPAIGKRLRGERKTYEVVGVVRDLKDGTGAVQLIAYTALTARDFARPPAGGITILARSDSATDALSGVQGAIGSIDPNLTCSSVNSQSPELHLAIFTLNRIRP